MFFVFLFLVLNFFIFVQSLVFFLKKKVFFSFLVL